MNIIKTNGPKDVAVSELEYALCKFMEKSLVQINKIMKISAKKL